LVNSAITTKSLKAAAQALGVESGSTGWAILERLVSAGAGEEGEWGDIWRVLGSGKVRVMF
jgi:hypothetical protein